MTTLPAIAPATAVAAAQSIVPGFNLANQVDVGAAVPSPTDFVFLAGTTNFVIVGKCGTIALGHMGGGDLQNTTLTGISWPSQAQVTCAPGDRGLLGIAVDPGTTTVYLIYDYTPGAGASCPDGSTTQDGLVYGRMTTLTMNSPTAPTTFSNEQSLIDCLPSFSANHLGTADDSHTIGTVLVAPDHTVFAGTGEASSYNFPDESALNAQDIHSPRGKIFHINPDGSPAAGNPYLSDGNYWAMRVFAYGLRNPFRFTLLPGTNSTLYIGDVGWNNREEIDVSTGGENFGWPCYEGPLDYRNGYDTDAVTGPVCQAEYANPPANLKAPLYWWAHDAPAKGHGALAGAFALGAPYGSYSGAFFFGDFEWTRLWALQPPAGSAFLPGNCPGDAFACDLTPAPQIPDVTMTAIHQGPNGDLYINDIEGHRVMELRFGCSGGDCPPFASAFVTPVASRNLATEFRFDASASTDPDPGDSLTFSWDFGDGTAAVGAVVTHRYLTHGDFTARVTVTDNLGVSDAASVHVTTNHDPPTLTLAPNRSGSYSVGDPVTITATAVDENGNSIPANRIQWAPVLHHCPTGVASGFCHIHPQDTPTGTTYTTTVPDHGDDSYLEFIATATDSLGLSTTAHFNLPMDEHTIDVGANVAGVTMTVNGGGGPTPLAAKAITNSLNRVTAPATFDGTTFLRWSDGDTSPTKQFTMPPSDVSLTAVYGLASAGAFSPVTPYRLFDTRDPAQRPRGAGNLGSGAEMAFDLSTQPTAPAHATSVLLNVTATNPAADGYVRAYPCGSVPSISTVNYSDGQTVANLAMVKVPSDKRICFESLVPTDLVVDVAGWFSPEADSVGSTYTSVTPARVLDTRLTAQTLMPNQELHFELAGRSEFPTNATAALLNVTATNTQEAGYIKVYPCGEEQTISNVNYVAGQTVANLAAVKVAAGGAVCFKSFAQADVVVDLAGWFAPGTGSGFVSPDPVRLFDTRNPALAPNGVVAPLAAGGVLAVQVAGTGGVPAEATAVALNVTAADPDAAGYVTAYPCGTSPVVSNVNYEAHQVAVANLAVVRVPPDGRVCFSSFASTDLVVDLAGWFVG